MIKINADYDVIILGGGINGCATARKLSQEGKRVCFLEGFTIGCG
ncbi:MAG: FAD-dependent oxidoreductase, partial [Porphyromonadaceae bacterium]|nr:FAD-dependent oxidoreductase [Porphyromonadaceae bacterium]